MSLLDPNEDDEIKMPPASSAREVASLLSECLDEVNEQINELGDAHDITIRSFKEAGVLTGNEGFVIRFNEDDREFQVTVVRSK